MFPYINVYMGYIFIAEISRITIQIPLYKYCCFFLHESSCLIKPYIKVTHHFLLLMAMILLQARETRKKNTNTLW